MIKYDRLFQSLKENGISQYTLRTKYHISPAQIDRLRKNESVTTYTLNIFLNILGPSYSLDDIAEFIPDDVEFFNDNK